MPTIKMEYGGFRARLDVSIRVINWNTHELLERCITSVIENTENTILYEMIIIDNNSSELGFKEVKQKFSGYKNFMWIENNKNMGGLVDDVTLPYCHGRHLLILGPDAFVFPQCIEKMVDFLDNNKEAGAVTAKLLNPDGSPQNYYYKFWDLSMFFYFTTLGRLIDKLFFNDRFKRYYFGGDIDANKITVLEQPAAACLMLRWQPPIVDYITDKDFPFYFNDVDLCKRIYGKGYKIFLLPDAEVIHFHGSSFKKANNRWARKEFRISLIRYFRKYHRNKVVLLRILIYLDEITRLIQDSFNKFKKTTKNHNG